jgi:hypothetical protein
MGMDMERADCVYFRKVVRGAESSDEEGEGSWEKMQIRKGITGPQVPPHAFPASSNVRKMLKIKVYFIYLDNSWYFNYGIVFC